MCENQRPCFLTTVCFSKVFEVNASSQRSGRLILSQLKEATQSHQVDSQGVNAHKPTYFNSYGTSSSAGALRPGSSPSMYRANFDNAVSNEWLACDRNCFMHILYVFGIIYSVNIAVFSGA